MNTTPPNRTGHPRISDGSLAAPLQDLHPYPADRSFVIKLHRSADLVAGQLHGRIVHLAGEQRADFSASAGLLPALQALIAVCLSPGGSH